MRTSTLGKLVTLAGVAIAVWSVLATMAAVVWTASGSTETSPTADFASQNHFVPGVLVFGIGVVIWIAGRHNESEEPSPENAEGRDSSESTEQ